MEEIRRRSCIKYASLIALIIQYVCAVIVTRYSRVVSKDKYLTTTAVAATEVCKLTFCIGMIFWEQGFSVGRTAGVFVQMVHDYQETAMLSVPALAYSIQNNLLLVAISNLDAATYQITYQLKILTTAIFSVTMLKRKILLRQWFSLVILMLGIGLVQVSKYRTSTTDEEVLLESSINQSSLIGIGCIVLASCTSGFAGVYFEKVVKTTPKSLWHQSFQLTAVGVVTSFAGVWLVDRDAISSHPDGFLQGYSSVTWAVIGIQTLSGILIAIIMKYADNILKGFAISCSIVLSSIISYYVFADVHPSWLFLVGGIMVVSATFLYGFDITGFVSQSVIKYQTHAKVAMR